MPVGPSILKLSNNLAFSDGLRLGHFMVIINGTTCVTSSVVDGQVCFTFTMAITYPMAGRGFYDSGLNLLSNGPTDRGELIFIIRAFWFYSQTQVFETQGKFEISEMAPNTFLTRVLSCKLCFLFISKLEKNLKEKCFC